VVRTAYRGALSFDLRLHLLGVAVAKRLSDQLLDQAWALTRALDEPARRGTDHFLEALCRHCFPDEAPCRRIRSDRDDGSAWGRLLSRMDEFIQKVTRRSS